MVRAFWPSTLVAGTLAALAGCSGFDVRERPAWRTQAEEACLAQGLVGESAVVTRAREISGPGICGLHYPFKVRALADGTVALAATETLDCAMIPALDAWVTGTLQPAATARFGEPVATIRTMGSYNCRGINNEAGANLSEHAFGNALDVGGFVLASGREISVMRGWNGGDPQAQAFLREAQAGACGLFTTVLAPGSNVFHYNHIHLDLAMHGSTSRGPRRICKPAPSVALPEPPRHDGLPEPPPVDEDMDVAARALPGEASGYVARVPSAGSPNATAVTAADRARLSDFMEAATGEGRTDAPVDAEQRF